MGQFGDCCCNDICRPSRIAYTYGEGVIDLNFEMINPTGIRRTQMHFGKMAEICAFQPTQTGCSPAVSPSNRFFLESAWKWFDVTYAYQQTQSIPTPTCTVFDGWQRIQTWLSLVSASVEVAFATDGTYHISAGATLSHTKAKSVWGTTTVNSNGSGFCESSINTTTEPPAVPYCRNDTACTTGPSGTCCFSGAAAIGPWGAGWASPGVYYDGLTEFATILASGWIPFATPMVATVADELWEFRQNPTGSQPAACRVPTGVTSTNAGNINWACGVCPRWDSAYSFTSPRSLSFLDRLVVEW